MTPIENLFILQPAGKHMASHSCAADGGRNYRS
jgi:hypothetical protein